MMKLLSKFVFRGVKFFFGSLLTLICFQYNSILKDLGKNFLTFSLIFPLFLLTMAKLLGKNDNSFAIKKMIGNWK